MAQSNEAIALSNALTREFLPYRKDVRKKIIVNIVQILSDISKFREESKKYVGDTNTGNTTNLRKKLESLNEELSKYPIYMRSETREMSIQIIELLIAFESTILKIKPIERLQENPVNVPVAKNYRSILISNLAGTELFLESLRKNIEKTLEEIEEEYLVEDINKGKKWWQIWR